VLKIEEAVLLGPRPREDIEVGRWRVRCRMLADRGLPRGGPQYDVGRRAVHVKAHAAGGLVGEEQYRHRRAIESIRGRRASRRGNRRGSERGNAGDAGYLERAERVAAGVEEVAVAFGGPQAALRRRDGR